MTNKTAIVKLHNTRWYHLPDERSPKNNKLQQNQLIVITNDLGAWYKITVGSDEGFIPYNAVRLVTN